MCKMVKKCEKYHIFDQLSIYFYHQMTETHSWPTLWALVLVNEACRFHLDHIEVNGMLYIPCAGVYSHIG